MSKLIAASRLIQEESWIDLHDIETGARIQAGRDYVYWNEFRRRCVMLVTSQAGEIWFAEADTLGCIAASLADLCWIQLIRRHVFGAFDAHLPKLDGSPNVDEFDARSATNDIV